MATISAIRVTLSGLGTGKTPDEIAQFMWELSIKAVRNGTNSGIIASYLRVMSLYEDGQDLEGFEFTDAQDTLCFVPRSVGIFAQMFDDGRYPFLEE